MYHYHQLIQKFKHHIHHHQIDDNDQLQRPYKIYFLARALNLDITIPLLRYQKTQE
jgi:hypothetical protein